MPTMSTRRLGLGDCALQDGAVRVLPFAAFLRQLAGGRVLATAR
jgi:hypothetical protein